MIKLETIFSSNIPVDCHILKGRLNTDGIDCFIFDENIVWVHPFKAVAVGGVKLKVPSDQTQQANEAISKKGKKDLLEAMEAEILRQNEILKIRTLLRKQSQLLESQASITSKLLSKSEILDIIELEQKFKKLSEKHFNLTWKQFWYELFDPDRSFFDYLRPRPVDYYIENELVSNYNIDPIYDSETVCPKCQSTNVKHGYAIDFKLDVLYILLSVLFFIPFPLIRKNYYCFDCGLSFKRKKEVVNNI